MPSKGQKRKNLIIDTAKLMFIEKGYQSTHIGQICDELDIARGTVYQYFGNKREIIYSILETMEETFQDIFDIDSLTEFIETNPNHEAMENFIADRYSNCVKAVISEPIIIMLLYKEIVGLDEEVIERTELFLDRITKTICRDLDMLKEKGVYRNNFDSNLIATLILGSVQLIIHEYKKRSRDMLDIVVVKDVVDLIMKGIMA